MSELRFLIFVQQKKLQEQLVQTIRRVGAFETVVTDTFPATNMLDRDTIAIIGNENITDNKRLLLNNTFHAYLSTEPPVLNSIRIFQSNPLDIFYVATGVDLSVWIVQLINKYFYKKGPTTALTENSSRNIDEASKDGILKKEYQRATRFEGLFEMLFTGMPSAICVLDYSKRLIHYNAHFESFAFAANHSRPVYYTEGLHPQVYDIVHHAFASLDGLAKLTPVERMINTNDTESYWLVQGFRSFYRNNFEHRVLIFTDLTQSKHVEQQLKKHKKKVATLQHTYNTVLDNSANIIGRFSVDGTCLYINTATTDILQVESNNLIDKAIGEWPFDHEFRIALQTIVTDVAKGKSNINRKIKLANTHHFNLIALPEQSNSDEIETVLIVFNNITHDEQRSLHLQEVTDSLGKEVELTSSMLNQSRHKLQLIANNLSDIVFTVNTEMKVTFVNSAVQKYLGRDVNDFLGGSPTAFFDWNEDEQMQENLNKQILQLFSASNTSPICLRLHHKTADGTKGYSFATFALLKDQDTTVSEIIGTVQDITRQQTSVEYWRNQRNMAKLLAQFIDNTIFVLDTEHNILGVFGAENNPFFVAQNAENAKILTQFLPKRNVRDIIQLFAEAQKSNTPQSTDIEICTNNTTTYNFHVVVHPPKYKLWLVCFV